MDVTRCADAFHIANELFEHVIQLLQIAECMRLGSGLLPWQWPHAPTFDITEAGAKFMQLLLLQRLNFRQQIIPFIGCLCQRFSSNAMFAASDW